MILPDTRNRKLLVIVFIITAFTSTVLFGVNSKVYALSSAPITANHVFGQHGSFTDATLNNGDLSSSFFLPQSVFSDGNRVYIADFLDSRVVVYNGVPGAAGYDYVADYVS